MQNATFGAGCFWSVEAAFRKVPGAMDAAVGYMGGHTKGPSYEDVCSDKTGHVEVCQVTFDPKKVSYKKLLETFFSIHDPTQENGQGPDIGTQYRSVIFYHSEKQKKEAIESKSQLEKTKKHDKKIMTSIEPASVFYRAEEYHQRYLEKKENSVLGNVMKKLKDY